MTAKTLVTGFPRIGENRELKKALEQYWTGKIPAKELHEKARAIREKNWLLQQRLGIDLISCNDFSYYDSMLDTVVMLNAIPERFRGNGDRLQRYFAMARGRDDAPAMEMTKWFNTNYHYIVPELEKDLEFALDAGKILDEYQEAKKLGIQPKINLIGPVSFLGLSKTPEDGGSFFFFDRVLDIYRQLFKLLADLDREVTVQLEEPLFVKDVDESLLAFLKQSLMVLGGISDNIRILVSSYFEHSLEALEILGKAPIWGVALDFVHGPKNIDGLHLLKDKVLAAGVVDGRNIWVNDYRSSLKILEEISQSIPRQRILVATSCSLLHVPHAAVLEPESEVKPRLAFACEKTAEVAFLGRIFHEGRAAADEELIRERSDLLSSGFKSAAGRIHPEYTVRDGSFDQRIRVQKEILGLPELPTTTIGSFPQTNELRRLRRDFRKGIFSEKEYETEIRRYIDDCVLFQEEAGLDVLVHGEPERNDMVEYFGELLEGFHFTCNGWVQSYGSRCVKPPVIYTDIIDTIEAMDADVITIETARSGNRLLGVFRENQYTNEIGPGVYDIHSPRVPSVEEFEDQIRKRLEVLDRSRMWVNPDCGLKTRRWEQVRPALINMVKAVEKIRSES
ncbi:5-methyltetrahydropteroyltriglutamate--homocysteine S-methyltransferase [Marispirochaeta sp.]|uniref:5-methyltetrahydropteroyltriglutamate-- homocysteine S-methyltransferase n=1 Tax=Marispirochaeta sp. TaxID=2038653 RepID=UPI0029C92D36|nr:5-methyltetrahydropteroyltriglutamate--homocysteine S-methyltransferase [Marispirochaeta sp.]